MHEASALVAGATLAAARAVWSGETSHAANIAGGLHHAMRRSASGFCVYNDPAIAIKWMLAQGAERIAYVDVDVHHGDGVQAAFYDDPRVLTISLHEHPATLFPGTGLASEIGSGQGRGYAVNVALPAFTGDAGWLRAFDAVVPPLLRAFKPEVLVSQHGCDSHRLDPLANLELSVDGQRRAQLMVHDLAHEVAGGKWLLTGGGGYQLVQVVPRSWTHLLAVASGDPLDPALPTWTISLMLPIGFGLLTLRLAINAIGAFLSLVVLVIAIALYLYRVLVEDKSKLRWSLDAPATTDERGVPWSSFVPCTLTTDVGAGCELLALTSLHLGASA
jgi:acetoin utilization protein AcuC